MIFKTFWQNKNISTDKLTDNIVFSSTFNYKTNVATRFIDFDMFGHVNNSVYFTYLEVARSKYWEEIIKWDWKKTGVVIAHAELDYIFPILMEDKIAVHVKTSRIGTTSFDLEYEVIKIKDNEEVVCSRGKTVCIAINYSSKRPTAIPEAEKQRMINFEQIAP
ncbi:acyl-CoA thioesterase [Pedobacter changchengzhani]|uniref:Acyl-CoA thioesterase n=1 Tax=Pedobacter changchengzhani TaxID=2529274 RepID=A0A4R5MK15_9SPHI|nr:thioesterase family protein [Pedobacter changchengzhani]TDG35746.1 acyl-CoA thioesterase [Pedobacter changchengzhani]